MDGDILTVSQATALNGTVIPSGGTVVYTPNADYFGSDTISYTVSDGTGGTDDAIVDVTVTEINDLPVIVSQNIVPLPTPEDTGLLITLGAVTVSDVDNTFPDDFTLNVLAGQNYSVSGDTVTPALNFNGILQVRITVNDGSDDSAEFSLTVEVTPVNDAPAITNQVALSTPEDSSLPVRVQDLTVFDPDNLPADFTLTVLPGSNYSVAINSVSLVTPDLNFNGNLTVPVFINDGLDDSATFNLLITIEAVNDAPLSELPIGDRQAVENSLFQLDISPNFTDVASPGRRRTNRRTPLHSRRAATSSAIGTPDTGRFPPGSPP